MSWLVAIIKDSSLKPVVFNLFKAENNKKIHFKGNARAIVVCGCERL